MATVSVNFNTNTDTLESVLLLVENMFSVASTLEVPAASNAGELNKEHLQQALAAEPLQTPNFDAAGLPWDGRIHAASKAVTGKGIWRAKVGLDPQVKLAVENELRAANPNTVAPAPVAPAPVAMPSLPNLPAMPVAESNFQKLGKMLAQQVDSGRLTNEWVQQCLAAYQVPGGLLPNVAGMGDEYAGQILAGISQALGL